MALAQQRRGAWRALTVEGVVYRWRARWSWETSFGVLQVRSEATPWGLLVVRIDLAAPWPASAAQPAPPSPPALARAPEGVGPGFVRRAILHALGHGWRPERRGRPFVCLHGAALFRRDDPAPDAPSDAG